MRRKSSMHETEMSVFIPSRRGSAGYVARWRDPQTRRLRQKTLGTKDRREAYRVAGEIADKIVSGVAGGIPWLEFCTIYERLHLRRRSKASMGSWLTTKWYIEEAGGVACLEDITSIWVAEWQEKLSRRVSPNTVATYSARFRAALRWAERHRFIDRAPFVAVEWEVRPASRAVTAEELTLILATVPAVRPRDASHWDRLLRGLGWCNLRIGELIRLSWDIDGEIRIEWHDGHPLIHLPPKSHKSPQDRYQPTLPQFWEVCAETPEDQRSGLVFLMPNGFGGQMSRKRIIRIIGKIGREAGVVTNPDTGKGATSHDIGRRAFLTKIDSKLTVAEAHKAMGHAKFQTTLDHYDTRSAAEITAKLWASR